MWRLAVLVLVALVLTPSQFRKFFVTLVALSVLLGTAVYQYNEHARQRTISVIPTEQVVIVNPVLDTSFGTYLKGRLENRSPKHTLREVEVRVTVHDCPGPESTPECEILSTQVVSLYGPVRPGSGKEFGTNIVIPAEVEGYPMVTCEILSTKGK